MKKNDTIDTGRRMEFVATDTEAITTIPLKPESPKYFGVYIISEIDAS